MWPRARERQSNTYEIERKEKRKPRTIAPLGGVSWDRVVPSGKEQQAEGRSLKKEKRKGGKAFVKRVCESRKEWWGKGS